MVTTLYTSSYYGIGSYGRVYGAMDYSKKDYATYSRITLSWIGEGWIGGPDTYTTSDSAYFTGTVGGASVLTASLSGSRSKTVNESSYVWIKAGGSSSYYKDITRGHSARSVVVKVSYKIPNTSSGTTYTGQVTLTVPALDTYTVTYNANGGSRGNVPATQTKYHGEALTLTSYTPTRSGWTFRGWGTSATSTTASYRAGGSYKTDSDITLYAIWSKDITLSYSAPGASNVPSNETKTIYNATTTATFTIPANVPTKTAYRFTGWLNGSTTYQPASQISLSASSTLTAQWTDDYVSPAYNEADYICTRSDGSEDSDTGAYGHIHFTWTNGSLAGVPFTDTTVVVKYTAHGSSNWINVINTSQAENTFDAIFGGNLDSATQYDVLLSLQDGDREPNEKTDFISTERFTMDVNADGTSIAFMMVAPDTATGVIAPDYNIYVNSGATSGADYDLIQALTALGWEDLI